MLNVLLESKPRRTRRIGGTVASTLVHAGVIAGAIALTVPDAVRATDGPKPRSDIHFIVSAPQPARAIDPPRGPAHAAPATPQLPGPVLKFTGPDLPTIHEVVSSTPTPSTTDNFGTGISPTPVGAPPGLSGPPGGVIEERYLDRSPRLIGNSAQPVFPPALRHAGRDGRVLVQFVVDTTGRAEMDGFKVIDASDSQFAESVRAVLPRYRFSPGEAGGRKVRTLVQLPFDFKLR